MKISLPFKSSVTTTTTTTMKVLMASVLLCLTVATRAELDLSNIDVSDLQNQLPAEFPKTNLTLDDVKTLIKDKCVKQAGKANGTAAYNDIEASTMVLAECVNGIINYTAIQEEISEASPNGDLDVVFNKYCLKRPEALSCIESFNGKLTPCLDLEERESQDIMMRIIRSLLNFICYKGGDQIALFISEKGPECLESHKDDIQNCINSTFSGYMPAEGIDNVKTIPKLVMGLKQCEDIERLESCIVKKLETCEEITPANVVESMFRFVKNETICRSARSSDNVIIPALYMVLFLQAVTHLSRKLFV